MTHKDLIKPAYKWVLKHGSCGVAFKELSSLASNGEYPDVIGFGMGDHSVLVECKCSRADFLADRKKFFRKNPEQGMGTFRFYLCPEGLIRTDELPKGWGLLWIDEMNKIKCVWNPFDTINIPPAEHVRLNSKFGNRKNARAEYGVMYSALRRLHIKGHIDCIYDKSKNTLNQP